MTVSRLRGWLLAHGTDRKQIHFEGLLLSKNVPQVGPTKACDGLQNISGEDGCKICVLPKECSILRLLQMSHEGCCTRKGLPGHKARGHGMTSPGSASESRARAACGVTKELTLLPGWGVFVIIPARKDFKGRLGAS